MKGFVHCLHIQLFFEQRQAQVALVQKPLVLKPHRIDIHGIISPHNLSYLQGSNHDCGNDYRIELIFQLNMPVQLTLLSFQQHH